MENIRTVIPNEFVDPHTHILPGIDDGAKTPNDSVKLLNMLKREGVTTVVLTPHFDCIRGSLESFVRRRRRALEELKQAMGPQGGLCLLTGCELYMDAPVDPFLDITPLCFEGTRNLLVELPWSKKWSAAMIENIYQLSCNQNIRPILAHCERYPAVQRDPRLAYAAVEAGCRLQVNIASLLDKGRKKLILRLLDQGLISFLASDCHDPVVRPPMWPAGLQALTEAVGPGPAAQLLQNGGGLLPHNGSERAHEVPF